MTERELIDAIFAGQTAESTASIVDDVMRDDASWSLFGWHEYLPDSIQVSWPLLGRSERLVAYAMAEHASRMQIECDE